MKIRWSIVFLALFGIVAAVAAAVLTASLSATRIQAAIPDKQEKRVDILVAAQDLPAMTTVTKDDIVTKTVLESQLPASFYSEPAQIIGKVLSLPVKEAQAYNKDSFPSQGSGLLLAAHLPKGKRAVTVALNDYSGLDGLLYPGCIVDVVASFKVDSSQKIGKAVSTTLLQNIEVLGVEDSTIVDQAKDSSAKSRGSRNGMRHTLMVTVMVDSRQAEALQLAMEHGTISLAMRNPNDVDVARSDATLLNDGNLARLAELLGPKITDGAEAEEAAVAEANDSADGEDVSHFAKATDQGTVLEPLAGATQASQSNTATKPVVKAKRSVAKKSATWQVDVRRGLASETRLFPVQN